MSIKPPACTGCKYEKIGYGFSYTKSSIGPLTIVGEPVDSKAPAFEGYGQIAASYKKIVKLLSLDEGKINLTNVVKCVLLEKTKLNKEAIRTAGNECFKRHGFTSQVILTAGEVATRQFIDVTNKEWNIKNFHSTINIINNDQLVIPTYEFSDLVESPNLTGAVLFATKLAQDLVKQINNGHPFVRTPTNLIIDPSVEQFKHWASQLTEDAWLAVDIETIGKFNSDEDEIDGEDKIVRINFSYNTGEGITVPFEGGYLEVIRKLLLVPGVKVFWNAPYDVPRLRNAGMDVHGKILDFMWAWHVLQSDLPKSLGFVAPYYSDYGPWKHLSGSDPSKYAAIDAVQTLRCAFGITKDLKDFGQWNAFYNHVYLLDKTVLQPATKIGLLVDKGALEDFGKTLEQRRSEFYTKLKTIYPESWLPLEGGVVKQSDKYPIPQEEIVSQKACKTCDARGITSKHRCKDKNLTPEIYITEEPTIRWYRYVDFNPNSTIHIGRYLLNKGYTPKLTETEKVSTNKLALETLAKKDEFFKTLLEYRAVEKILSTYVENTIELMDDKNTLHAEFLHKPSTMRLSCVRPNLTNVVADRNKDNPANGFRACIIPASNCYFAELDYSGIEAVETGWFSEDPDYIRLATLGVHAYLTSHLVGKPADLKWSDDTLRGYFKEIKKTYDPEYNRAKRVVHGTNYGLTPYGMVRNYPSMFTVKSATETQELYFALCPKLKQWQEATRAFAHLMHYLGGEKHPFRYKHWFWNVYKWNWNNKVWDLGSDSKRVIAYYPQSTAAGVLKNAVLALANPESPNYIGDVFEGQTPIRALIHDSILLEIPKNKLVDVLTKVKNQMTLPILEQPLPKEWNMGEYLKIGVSTKVGKNWLEMKEIAGNSLDYIKESLIE